MKVWIYKGDVVGGKRELSAAAPADRPRRDPAGTRPRRSGIIGHHGASTEDGRREKPRPSVARTAPTERTKTVMLIPRKVKHRKQHHPKRSGVSPAVALSRDVW